MRRDGRKMVGRKINPFRKRVRFFCHPFFCPSGQSKIENRQSTTGIFDFRLPIEEGVSSKSSQTQPGAGGCIPLGYRNGDARCENDSPACVKILLRPTFHLNVRARNPNGIEPASPGLRLRYPGVTAILKNILYPKGVK